MVLNKGDTIGIIALSGDCDRDNVQKSVKFFESSGYKTMLSKNIYDSCRYLAGSDEVKLSELEEFYQDNDIKLILCARGGYGAIRLINKINYEVIKANPKPLCGYSDATALLLMIYKKTGIINYHSPMACSDFANMETLENKTAQSFFSAINSENLCYTGEKIYKSGFAKGILWGGNLSTVVSLCGQDFIPEKKFVFFTEDLNEPVYKIDKMFQQLLNIEQFKNNCTGIVLGDFLDVDNEKWLEEYFSELSNRITIPIVSGFRITHREEKITLPIGKEAEINDLELRIAHKS